MISWRYRILGLIAIMSLASAAPALADCRSELGGRELVWAWNEWVPYAYQDDRGDPVGFDISLVRKILERSGCPFKFVKQPSKRAQLGLKDGSVDLMAAASHTPEREKFSYFSLPYRDERIALFARADQSDELADLTLGDITKRGLRVAAGLGGWYGKEFEANQQALLDAKLLVLTGDLEGRIKMLQGGRVDLVIDDQVAGIATARQLGVEGQLTILPRALNSDPVHLMLSRVSVPPAVVARIDEAIRWLSDNADYQMVIASYTKLPHP